MAKLQFGLNLTDVFTATEYISYDRLGEVTIPASMESSA
jgi:hypothetical protein